jgi:tetratricopeptide (TPR) repeat protein
MQNCLHKILIAGFACVALAIPARAQTTLKPAPAPAASTDASASARQAVSLASRGRCKEALPALKRTMAHLADKDLRYRSAMAAARCAMSIDDSATAVDALLLLRHDFPDDPEVLYVSVHFFSQLTNRAAQDLAEGFPTSVQVAKLNAEALESAQKWDEAIAAYRQILTQSPALPEIHYRIARILLDESSGAKAAEAKAELGEELKINPDSAAAEFILGEIARQAAEWEPAIQHFTRASKLDVGFLEAYLALGMSLSSAGKYAEAISPLEQYAKMEPADPAGHYQLAMAYSRTGNKAGADHELQLQRDALEKAKTQRAPNTPVRQ